MTPIEMFLFCFALEPIHLWIHFQTKLSLSTLQLSWLCPLLELVVMRTRLHYSQMLTWKESVTMGMFSQPPQLWILLELFEMRTLLTLTPDHGIDNFK